MDGQERGRRTLELWVRSYAPSTGPTRDRTIDRVRALAASDAVAASEVDLWGPAIERSERLRQTRAGRRIHDRLERFERWAERTGRSLEPFFRTRTVETDLVSSGHRTCRPPALALAEFEGDRLVHVAPSRADGRRGDVADRLDALERETRSETDAAGRPREVTRRSD